MSNKKKDNLLEKHYTPTKLMDFMYGLLERNNIIPTEWLENSAGDGRMVDYLKSKTPNINVRAFDILNETKNPDIIELDYLKHPITYKEGRVCFMNPPFHKTTSFIKKAFKECDYVVGIYSPSSMINIDWEKYELVDDIYWIKNADFQSVKMDIVVILLKRLEV